MVKRIVMADDATGEFDGVVQQNLLDSIELLVGPTEVYSVVPGVNDWSGSVTLTQEESQSRYYRRRLTGNVIISMDPGLSDKAYSCSIEFAQDSTGGRSVIFANVATSHGIPIPLTSTPNAVDIIRLEWNGSRWAALLGGSQFVIPTAWTV